MSETYLGDYQGRGIYVTYQGDEITLRWWTLDYSDDIIKMDSKVLFKLLGFVANLPGNEGTAT